MAGEESLVTTIESGIPEGEVQALFITSELRDKRDEAFAEAAEVLGLDDMQRHEAARAFSPEMGTTLDQRLAALSTIARWVRAELKFLEEQKWGEVRWEARYVSISDPEGAIRGTFTTHEAAQEEVDKINYASRFGSGRVVHRILSLDLKDGKSWI